MNCPQCHKDIHIAESNYLSMFTCPHCAAVYFIDIQGQPEYGDMSVPLGDSGLERDIATTIATSLEANVERELEAPHDFLNSSANPFETLSEPSADFGAVAQEIAAYGNQDQSVGVLTYDVHISGLDTKDLVTLFREAVNDSKMGWLPQDIVIKDGECKIQNMNAIQAYILAKRIQFLDIETEWIQNAQT